MSKHCFFEQSHNDENFTTRCTLSVLIDERNYWQISWFCNENGERLPGRYVIETGITGEREFTGEQIPMEAIETCPGVDKNFVEWAISGYRNYLLRNIRSISPVYQEHIDLSQ